MLKTDTELVLTRDEAGQLAEHLNGQAEGRPQEAPGGMSPVLKGLLGALGQALMAYLHVRCAGPGDAAGTTSGTVPATVIADGHPNVSGDRATVSMGGAPAVAGTDGPRAVDASIPAGDLSEEEQKRRERFPHGDAGRAGDQDRA